MLAAHAPLGPVTLIYSGRRGYPDAPLVVSEVLSTLGQDGRQRWRATAELGMDGRGRDPEAKMRFDALSQGHETKTAAAITASGSRKTRHDGTQEILVSSGRSRVQGRAITCSGLDWYWWSGQLGA